MQDLSHLSKGWPSYGASMGGGNMIDNDVPQGKAPGSESEQTEIVAQGVNHAGSVSPDLEVPAAQDDTKNVQSSSAAQAAAAWKMVK